MRRHIVKSPYLSLALRVLLGFLFLSLVALIFYIYYTGGWKDTLLYYRYFFSLKRLKLFVASFGPYAAPVYVLLQCMQVIIAPIPGELTGFVGGLLFGVWEGTLLSTIGLTIGSLVAFAIGRLLGAGFVHKIVIAGGAEWKNLSTIKLKIGFFGWYTWRVLLRRKAF